MYVKWTTTSLIQYVLRDILLYGLYHREINIQSCCSKYKWYLIEHMYLVAYQPCRWFSYTYICFQIFIIIFLNISLYLWKCNSNYMSVVNQHSADTSIYNTYCYTFLYKWMIILLLSLWNTLLWYILVSNVTINLLFWYKIILMYFVFMYTCNLIQIQILIFHIYNAKMI